MTDGDLAEELSDLSLLDVKAKHKKQLKELEARSTKMRHSVPKGDKKRLKEVKDQIARMEAELKAEQERELKAAEENSEPGQVTQPAEPVKENEKHGTSRAQRRRDKKAAAAAEKAQKSSEADNVAESLREAERLKILAKLKPLDLNLFDVVPDGDCLFSALKHQLHQVHGIESSVPALRLQAADLMRQNMGDYMPFLESPTDETGFRKYCDKMETTHEWGGQMELTALSRALGFPIRVIQADGPDIELSPGLGANRESLVITFHRREYGLGEHYNSTEPNEKSK